MPTHIGGMQAWFSEHKDFFKAHSGCAKSKYNEKRLEMFVDKKEFLEMDKEYLIVSDKIRPSDAKIELAKSISLHDERLKFSIKAIQDEKELVGYNKELMGKMGELSAAAAREDESAPSEPVDQSALTQAVALQHRRTVM